MVQGLQARGRGTHAALTSSLPWLQPPHPHTPALMPLQMLRAATPEIPGSVGRGRTSHWCGVTLAAAALPLAARDAAPSPVGTPIAAAQPRRSPSHSLFNALLCVAEHESGGGPCTG